ncbi:hypothetical protein E308F_22550 [Moorella sp. E308F]|nr:hypothetical protein E308F_22550 [Moorella sp. E308F]
MAALQKGPSNREENSNETHGGQAKIGELAIKVDILQKDQLRPEINNKTLVSHLHTEGYNIL